MTERVEGRDIGEAGDGRLPPPEDFESPPGLRAVAAYDDFRRSGDAGLALLAMGVPYWTFLHGGRYVLCVASDKADRALAEIRATEGLRRRRPERGDDAPGAEGVPVGAFSFAFYGLVLIGFFAWQQVGVPGVPGRVNAAAMVEAGEWWRAVTALTLHGDVVHLASNLVAGAGFAFFLARYFGAGRAWFLILASGVAGNALNAWVRHPEVHHSIGASTAVFGALGLLTGTGLRLAVRAPKQRWSLPRWLAPVLGGVTLLGLLGVGERGGRVDVPAHISGFLCGTLLGALVAHRPARSAGGRADFLWGCAAAGLVAVGWACALGLG